MTRTLRTALTTAALLTAALGLAGCGLTPAPAATLAPVVDDSPAPSSTDEPTTAPTDGPADDGGEAAAASGTRPEARTGATCDDLTSPAQLDPLFTPAVSLVGPTRTAEYIGAGISDEYVIRQAGGVACEWQSADSQVTSEGQWSYDGLKLRLLPATLADWTPFSEAEASGASEFWTCWDSGDGCSYDVHTANGWWLNLDVFWTDPRPSGAASEADAAPVFADIVDTVSALAAPVTPWSAPEPEVALGPDCTGVLTGAQLFAAVGLSGSSEHEALRYPSQLDLAQDATGATQCRWLASDEFTDLVQIDSLPGGAWGSEAMQQSWTDLGISPEHATIAGLTEASPIYTHVGSHDAKDILKRIAAAIVAAH